MHAEDKLKQKYGTDSGHRLPPDFFEEFRRQTLASLPERTIAPAPKLTTWQRLKPYLALAAMFAGIWCILKMVTMMETHQDSASPVSLENPPALVAQAMSTPEVADASLPMVSMTNSQIKDMVSDLEDGTEKQAEQTEQKVSAPDMADQELLAQEDFDIDLDLLAQELAQASDDPYHYY